MEEENVYRTGILDASQKMTEISRDRESVMRQGTVTAIQAGPPRTVTVTVGGTSLTGVRLMNHVAPVLNEGVWIVDIGMGRWLCIGTSSSIATTTTFQTSDTTTSAIAIPASAHATSERAGLLLGNWIIGQDINANGTRDFFIWGGDPTQATRYLISPAGAHSISGALTVNHSSFDNVRSTGAGAGFRFDDRTDNNQYSALYRQSNVIYIYSSTAPVGNWFTLDGSSFTITNATNGLRLGSWIPDGSFTGVTNRSGGAANNYLIMADTTNTLISTPGATGSILLRPRNNGAAGQVTVDNVWLTAAGNISTNGQLRCYRNGGSTGNNATDAWYYNASVYAATADINGVSTASISFHPSGVAPQLRVGANDAQIYNRGADGVANNPFTASAFNVASTKRIKKNITEWPRKNAGSASESAAARIRDLRVVTFDRNEPGILKEVPTGRRSIALQRLNDYTRRNGLPDYELPDHDCSVHGCNGTAEEPCARVLNTRRMEYGLIAEEVGETIPEAVVYDSDRLPNAINYSMLNAVTIAAVKELIERIEALEQSAP